MGNSQQSMRNIQRIEDEAVSGDHEGGGDQGPFIANPAPHQHGQRAQNIWIYTTPPEVDTKEHEYQLDKQSNNIINQAEMGADLVVKAHVSGPSSHYSKQLSSGTFENEEPVASPHSPVREDIPVNYVCNTPPHHSSQEQPSQLDGQKIQPEEQISIDDRIQYHTPESLYNDHIALGKVNVELFACAAIICGTKNCTKTQMLHSLLDEAVKFFDENQERGFFEESLCLSLCKCIILGCYPYDNYTWLKTSSNYDESMLSLFSYLSRLCKMQKQEERPFHDLIELCEPIKGENVNIQPQEVASQFLNIFEELRKLWQRMKKDEALQAVAPQRICLINIFDIGHTQSGQDILPFLSQYCKHALTVVCYDVEHEKVLQDGLEEKNQGDRETPEYMLLKQLCGVHKENPVALVALGDTDTRDKSGLKKIADCLKDKIDVNKITAVSVTQDSTCISEVKKFIENQVMIAPFNCSKPSQYFMLHQRINKSAKSFWMRRKEIEPLYSQYKFDHDSLDDVLQFFTKFGHLWYMHDVPALRQYVIVNLVKFSKKVEELYQSDEDTADYGLLRHRDDEDSRVVFDILTTLGIAAEVKSSQIIDGIVSLDTATNYYYIPTIRKPMSTLASGSGDTNSPMCNNSQNQTTDSDCLLQKYTCTARILQVSLLKHLLINKSCLLVPNKDISMTVVRFFSSGDQQKYHDIEFIDNGGKFVMYLKTEANTRSTLEVKDAFSLMMKTKCPFFKQEELMDTTSFLDEITDARSETKKITSKSMLKIAKHIANQDKTKQEEFSIKLGFEQNHIEKKMQEEDEEAHDEILIDMLDEFQKSKGTNELIKCLRQYNRTLLDRYCK